MRHRRLLAPYQPPIDTTPQKVDSPPTGDFMLRAMDAELLSIGRFARLTGLSIGALRHYHELGLLQPAAVDPMTGYRSYAPCPGRGGAPHRQPPRARPAAAAGPCRPRRRTRRAPRDARRASDPARRPARPDPAPDPLAQPSHRPRGADHDPRPHPPISTATRAASSPSTSSTAPGRSWRCRSARRSRTTR